MAKIGLFKCTMSDIHKNIHHKYIYKYLHIFICARTHAPTPTHLHTHTHTHTWIQEMTKTAKNGLYTCPMSDIHKRYILHVHVHICVHIHVCTPTLSLSLFHTHMNAGRDWMNNLLSWFIRAVLSSWMKRYEWIMSFTHTHMNAGRGWMNDSVTSCIHVCVKDMIHSWFIHEWPLVN